MSHTPTTPSPNSKSTTHQARKPRKRPLARSYQPAAAPVLLDTKEAADALRLSAEALRARCRRAAVVAPDGSVSATLAPGIVAVKFGANTWRVRFDHATNPAA
jgi:hypothetical protein